MSFQERLPSKVMNTESLMHWVSAWRLQGFKVVFTNGVFDILHKGHVDYLMKAADLGDRLIIGLNSDASVKLLSKGSNRPIQDQDSRAFILSSMAFVNAINIFDEETPQKLIEMVSPDVLVKGGDYKIEDIAGSGHVLKRGGKVITIPLVEGYSTSAIESRIKSS